MQTRNVRFDIRAFDCCHVVIASVESPILRRQS